MHYKNSWIRNDLFISQTIKVKEEDILEGGNHVLSTAFYITAKVALFFPGHQNLLNPLELSPDFMRDIMSRCGPSWFRNLRIKNISHLSSRFQCKIIKQEKDDWVNPYIWKRGNYEEPNTHWSIAILKFHWSNITRSFCLGMKNAS